MRIMKSYSLLEEAIQSKSLDGFRKFINFMRINQVAVIGAGQLEPSTVEN